MSSIIFRKAPKVDKKKKKMMNESVHGAQLVAGVCKVLDRLTLGSPFFENNTRNNFPKFSQQDGRSPDFPQQKTNN